MPKLKELLSEETLETVQKEVQEELDTEDVNFLVNTDNNEYIPRERLNTKNDKIEALEEQRSNLEDQLKQLKEDTQATEELRDKIENLEDQNEQIKEQKSKELEQRTKELQTKLALKDHGARNPDVVTPLLNMDEITLKENGDRIEVEGIEDQLEEVKEENDYLFEPEEGEEETPGKSGGQFEGGSSPPSENPFTKENPDLQRRGEILQENPARAKELIKEAGKDPANFGLD